MIKYFKALLIILLYFWTGCTNEQTQERVEYTKDPFPGEAGQTLDMHSRWDTWEEPAEGFLGEFVRVPRNEVVGFALYTHQNDKLKITAQLYPLKPEESREVRLEMKKIMSGSQLKLLK